MNPPPQHSPTMDEASTPSPPGGTTPTGSLTPTGAGSTTPGANSQSRRPPRKSTLTQQQKNQKRQRATQDQLVLLELEFNKNPTPTAAVRERIAQEINMTERSVQIWFQNRRAKIKLLAKKSIETGEDCDAIPESYRQYLAMQAMESGKPLNRNFFQQPMFGGGVLLPPEHQSPQKVVIHHFQCRSLSIGSWRRVGQNAMDLVIFYSLGDKPCLTYYINNDAAGYKIEFPFSYIKNITLENGQSGPNMRPAGLVVELNRPPNFFMDNAGSGGFNQCGDFTEDQQASKVLVHHLGGDPRVLSGQLAKLTLLESFQNRHNPMFDNSAAVSAPVSPIGRPASQPNVMAPPPVPQHQEHAFGASLAPGPRGHKRQRSRSVPAITDFSFLSQPMPSFHIQHPSVTDASIFQPMPQHPHNLQAGHPLRINTAPSGGYGGMEFARPYPMSAAATGSPGEFGSPNFFGPGGEMEHMHHPHQAHQQPSYTLPFLSPMGEQAAQLHPSPSPLSAVSHGDPVIADQSPPLANMGRSNSADFLNMSQDQSAIADDGLMLGDMYQKGNFSLPFRGPGMGDSQLDMGGFHEEPSSEEMDPQQQNMAFNTIDPSALSSENQNL